MLKVLKITEVAFHQHNYDPYIILNNFTDYITNLSRTVNKNEFQFFQTPCELK